MHYVQKLVILFSLTLFCQLSVAQVGREFWFSAPEMAMHSRDMSLRLFVYTHHEACDITIDMPANPHYRQQVIHLDSAGYQEIVLAENYDQYMAQYAAYHNQVTRNALHIFASCPISATIQMSGVNGETYALKGENALGTDFNLAMQNQYRNSNAQTKHHLYDNAYSSAQIIAVEDSTIVHISSSQLLFGDTILQARDIILNRGQVYSFRASSKRAEMHITSTTIHASKPVVVNTMDDSMSPYQKYFGEDAVADQIVPNTLLGNKYIAISNGLKWEGVIITDLLSGQTTFKQFNGKEAIVIQSDNPIQVFQITGCWNEAGGAQLPAIDKSGSYHVKYHRLCDTKWTYITILTKTTNINAIYVNQVNIRNYFNAVADDPTWSFAKVDVSSYSTALPIEVTSTDDIFHLSVIDASSAVKSASGKDVPTSCSFGYFSSYNKHNLWDANTNQDTIDLLPQSKLDSLPTLDSLTVIDSVAPKDSAERQLKHRAHHLLLYGEGAYSHLPFFNNDFAWGLGYGAGAGILYEYQKNHFLLDIGAGFLWQDVEHKSQYSLYTDYIDSQGTLSHLRLQMNRSDRSKLGYVEVPVLVGGSWSWLYLLGGIKVGVPIFGKTKSTMNISDYAIYDRYIDAFKEMPNHGLRTNVPNVKSGDRIHAIVDTRISFEIGANLGNAHIEHNCDTLDIENTNITFEPKVTYRLGLYADYGYLWPIPNNGETPLMDPTDLVNFSSWPLTHPINSSVVNGKLVGNFFAGIKLTIIFSTKKQ